MWVRGHKIGIYDCKWAKEEESKRAEGMHAGVWNHSSKGIKIISARK